MCAKFLIELINIENKNNPCSAQAARLVRRKYSQEPSYLATSQPNGKYRVDSVTVTATTTRMQAWHQ